MTGIEIGTAVVAYIEPHAGLAREFNRWYELDHFYAAAMAGPGMFAGARWVATRECKAVRPPGADLFGDPQRGSYLATYWLLPGMQSQWDAWVTQQMEALVAEGGRMFAGRDHLHTSVYAHGWEAMLDGAPPAIAALDHPFRGVIAVAAPEPGASSLEAWVASRIGADLPVAVGFVPERVILSATDPGPHRLAILFCAGDPVDAWTRHVAPALAELPSIGFASPFRRTVPGTDRYTDAL
jgi:hypothetical protein